MGREQIILEEGWKNVECAGDVASCTVELPFAVYRTAASGQGLAPAAGSPQAAGQQVFATRCASCHGTNAMGGEFAPSIVERVPLRSDDELVSLLHNGLPSSGMPAFPDIVDQERANLISFLRTLKPLEGELLARAPRSPCRTEKSCRAPR